MQLNLRDNTIAQLCKENARQAILLNISGNTTAGLNQELNSAKKAMSGLKNELTTLKKTNQQLQKDLDNCKALNAKYKNQVDTQSANINILNSELSRLRNDNAQLTVKLKQSVEQQQPDKITSLNLQLVAANEQITEANNQLKKVSSDLVIYKSRSKNSSLELQNLKNKMLRHRNELADLAKIAHQIPVAENQNEPCQNTDNARILDILDSLMATVNAVIDNGSPIRSFSDLLTLPSFVPLVQEIIPKYLVPFSIAEFKTFVQTPRLLSDIEKQLAHSVKAAPPNLSLDSGADESPLSLVAFGTHKGIDKQGNHMYELIAEVCPGTLKSPLILQQSVNK